MRGFFGFNGVVGIFTKGTKGLHVCLKWRDIRTKGSYINELAVIL